MHGKDSAESGYSALFVCVRACVLVRRLEQTQAVMALVEQHKADYEKWVAVEAWHTAVTVPDARPSITKLQAVERVQTRKGSGFAIRPCVCVCLRVRVSQAQARDSGGQEGRPEAH